MKCPVFLLNQPHGGSIHTLIHPSGPTLTHDAVYLPIYLYYRFTFIRINQTTCPAVSFVIDAVSTGTYLPFFH